MIYTKEQIEALINRLKTDAIDLGIASGYFSYDRIREVIDALAAQAARIEDLERQRDAILMQARIWSQEARTQKCTVDQIGSVLGDIPDWGPIVARVVELERDATRYRWLRDSAHADGFVIFSYCDGVRSYALRGDAADAHIDAASKGEEK